MAIALHALLGLALARVSRYGLHVSNSTPVEVDLVAQRPPEPLPPPPEPPPPESLHKPVVHRPMPKPALRPPPMPNQETKPAPASQEEVKPVFGVTQDSVVEGESPVAVPVGNTLMTKDRTLAKEPPPPLPPAPPPPPAFAPVDEESVAEFPEAYYKPEPQYPELARRMGVEGKVRLKIGVDRKGNVKSVRVLEEAGYGMDEEAVKVAWQYKFKPAKLSDGRPVDLLIPYVFYFRSQPR